MGCGVPNLAPSGSSHLVSLKTITGWRVGCLTSPKEKRCVVCAARTIDQSIGRRVDGKAYNDLSSGLKLWNLDIIRLFLRPEAWRLWRITERPSSAYQAPARAHCCRCGCPVDDCDCGSTRHLVLEVTVPLEGVLLFSQKFSPVYTGQAEVDVRVASSKISWWSELKN